MRASNMEKQDTLWRRTARGSFSTMASLPDTVDVAVIGAGFTGLTTALCLARAGRKVAVLERSFLGEGASGQNAGFVVPNFALADPQVVHRKLGEEKGNALLDLVSQGADAVFETIRDHGIACDALQSGWLNPAVTDDAADMLKGRAEFWQSRNRPVRYLSQPEILQQTGMTLYKGALLDESGGTIHPLDYLFGLAHAVEAQGGTVHEAACVKQARQENANWHLTLEDGRTLSARQIVYCTNAFTKGVSRRLGLSTVPLRVYQVATRPIAQEVVDRIAPDRRSVGDTRKNLFTYRLDRENRLISGGMSAIPIGAKKRLGEAIVNRLAHELSLPTVPEIEVVWTGVAAMTPDFLPRIHCMGDNAFAGIGCNGRGIAMTTQLGRVLADALMGAPVDRLPIPLRKVRRLPFHSLMPLATSASLIMARIEDKLAR
ncbi:FAD-binding oxidoreductase [Stappia sp. BW2]|uniref:NAD(P)/FAD-dependent oxidoreductase n=1 Tax=Stappia sp. BW2 TaxID=2592622 RepID=UPI0011DEEFED|nr:FAD-binding oxidoreductase [Stappia sp. BW2]TYC63143.1 FAD-binding oxidoreductase [Stappia sp. BW2]